MTGVLVFDFVVRIFRASSGKCNCRSWLAREEARPVDIDIGYETVFAGKPAPTKVRT